LFIWHRDTSSPFKGTVSEESYFIKPTKLHQYFLHFLSDNDFDNALQATLSGFESSMEIDSERKAAKLRYIRI
jgi:hypothetical protein